MHALKLCFVVSCVLTVANSEVALVIGGFGASDSVQVITKDATCLGLSSNPVIPKAPDGRVGWVGQYVDGKIVVCGGAKVDFYRNCFSLKVGEGWHGAGQMVYQKRYAESLVFNGEMIVMGGYNQNMGWLNAVEKRSSDGTWTEMEPWAMPRMIFDFCAVQMDDHRIMVLGGNIIGQFDSNDMDILDTTTNTWSKGPSMAKRRATHDCIVTEHNGERGVMVTGGCSSNCLYHLKDTSFFSFASETWTELEPMNVGRMGHKMTVIGGKPTVIGGFDHGELKSIEEFDGTSWQLRSEKIEFATYVFASPDEIPENVSC